MFAGNSLLNYSTINAGREEGNGLVSVPRVEGWRAVDRKQANQQQWHRIGKQENQSRPPALRLSWLKNVGLLLFKQTGEVPVAYRVSST
jgi:hypothetical protein